MCSKNPHLFYADVYGGIEKTFWWWITPILICSSKLCIRQMTRDTGHQYIASSPSATKVELEGVVLDKLIPRV